MDDTSTRWRHVAPVRDLEHLGEHLVAHGGDRVSLLDPTEGARTAVSAQRFFGVAIAAQEGSVFARVSTERGAFEVRRLALPSLALGEVIPLGSIEYRAVDPLTLRDDGALVAGLAVGKKPQMAVWRVGVADTVQRFEKSWTDRSAVASRASFSPDGTRLAVALHPQWPRGAKDRWDLTVWDVATGAPTVLKGHRGALLEVRFGPDGTLYALDARGTVRAWDLATKKPRWVFHSGLWTQDALSTNPRLAVSRDGARVCAGIPQAGVFLLDARDGRVRWSEGVGASKEFLPVAFSRDGARVFTGDGGGVRVRDARDGRAIAGPDGPVVPVTRLRQGSRGWTALTDAPATAWTRTDDGAWRAHAQPGTAATSADGDTLATVTGRRGEVRDLRDGALRGWVAPDSDRDLSAMSVSRDGRLLALLEHPAPRSATKAGRLSVYSVDEARVTAVIAEGGDYLTAKLLGFSPDATRLVVSRDDQPRIFDVTRRAWVAEVFGVLGSVSSPCVADDEHALYAVDDGCLLLRWSLDDGALTSRATLPKDVSRLFGVRGGRALLYGAAGLVVWDVARAEVVETLAAREVSAAAFARDGAVVYGTDDGLVHGLGPARATSGGEPSAAVDLAWIERFVAAAERGDVAEATALAASSPDGVWRELAAVERAQRALVDLEASRGVTDAHRTLTSRWIAQGVSWRWRDDARVPGAWEGLGVRGDGRYLAVGTACAGHGDPAYGALLVIDLEVGRCVWADRQVEWGCGQGRGMGNRERVRWSGDGARLGTAWAQSGVQVYDAFGGVRFAADVTNGADSGPAWCFTHDGREVVYGTWLWEGYVFEKKSALPFAVVDCAGASRSNPYRALDEGKGIKGVPDDNWWTWMGASPDGARLCAVQGACSLVLDLPSGAVRFLGPGAGVGDDGPVPFSHDGRWFFTGSTLWAAEPKAKGVAVGAPCGIDARWSPVEDLLALAGDEGVTLWRASAHRAEGFLPCAVDPHLRAGVLGDIHALAFSPDGQVLAVRTDAGAVLVWSFRDGGSVAVPADASAKGMALGPDARTLACWSEDTLWVWRLADLTLLYTLRARDELGALWTDDGEHPLLHPGGNAAHLFAEDPCFPVSVDGARAWVAAFETGLVLCPPAVRARLDERVSMALHGRVGWPLRWAEGSDAVAVVDTWEAAWAHPRWPSRIPQRVRAWQDPSRRPEPDAAKGFSTPEDGASGPSVKCARTSGFYGPERVVEVTSPAAFEALAPTLSGRVVRVHVDGYRGREVQTGALSRSDAYWMLWSTEPGNGGGHGVTPSEVRRVEVLRYLGHPDDALEAPPTHAPTSLRNTSVWLGALSKRERAGLEPRLATCDARVADSAEAADWYVMPLVYEREKKLEALAAMPAVRARPLPYWTCYRLTERG